MEAILVLAHGSKRTETEETLNSLVRQVKEKTSNDMVFPAFLQFSESDMESSIKEAYEKGARRIKVVPLFIFDGIHVTVDIPAELEEVSRKFEGLEISMGGHIGDDSRLADIIVDRIAAIG